MKYKGIETSYSLLISYEVLALQYRRRNEPREGIGDEHFQSLLPGVTSPNSNNFSFTFALLNINAAIIEGIMRSMLSEIVSEEVARQE